MKLKHFFERANLASTASQVEELAQELQETLGKCKVLSPMRAAEYDPDMEGLLVRNISESPKYKLSDFFTRNLKLLQGLQCAHDIFLHRDGLAAMERKLQNIADSCNLVYMKP